MLKRIFVYTAIAASPIFLYGQGKNEPPANWQNLDLQSQNIFGISTEKAHSELLNNKKAHPVIVAVIDGGIESAHEDLKDVMWINSKEIAGNNIDDDNNGYIDDIHGWNFIGSKKGNVQYDNLEVTRLYRTYLPKYGAVVNSTPLSETERAEFIKFQKITTDYMSKLQMARIGLENTTLLKRYLDEIVAGMGKEKPTLSDFEAFKPASENQSKALKIIKSALKDEPDFSEFEKELKKAVDYYDTQIKYHLNLEFDPRDIVGDNYNNNSERFYGNNDVMGPDAEHGTHVAGIVAAKRNNDLGIKGVAANVRIMAVRAVPDGDERDKDVANAIRYAVDNGASVINMSFGKAYTSDKVVVDSAVRYAMAKDVLLVHAAGNDGENTDLSKNYPTRNYSDSTGLNTGQAPAWIGVGASGWVNDESLKADFSNYGKKSVDVFAPGVDIRSTVPQSKYEENDGTSMAAPVVSGLAALIRSYYPGLSAVQVKNIIMDSVSKVDHKVKVNDGGNSRKVSFSEISVTGGVVNAYKALRLAEDVANGKAQSGK